MHTQSKKQRAFTLIELMIVVAIIAILVAIAYPSYTNYVKRGYRSEGVAQLNDAAARMERYYAQNNNYSVGADLSKIGITNALSSSSMYKLTANGTATAYTLTSTPQGSQATDTCGTLTLDQSGTRTPDPTTTACWK